MSHRQGHRVSDYTTDMQDAPHAEAYAAAKAKATEEWVAAKAKVTETYPAVRARAQAASNYAKGAAAEA